MSEHQLPLLLLVEDEHFTRELVEGALRDSGFELAVARTGEEGIVLLEETRSFRGVVTDIDLGGDINGWAVARRARELGSDTSIVYMTGGSAGQWMTHGVPLSVLVTKPFAEGQIVTAITGLLNGPPVSAD
jgi:DNA-binding response OmpR family regulator